jgi:hypothetical protein
MARLPFDRVAIDGKRVATVKPRPALAGLFPLAKKPEGKCHTRIELADPTRIGCASSIRVELRSSWWNALSRPISPLASIPSPVRDWNPSANG